MSNEETDNLTYLPPDIIDLGDAGELTQGNARGSDIDPGIPPTSNRKTVVSS